MRVLAISGTPRKDGNSEHLIHHAVYLYKIKVQKKRLMQGYVGMDLQWIENFHLVQSKH